MENPLMNEEFKEEVIHTRENKFKGESTPARPILQSHPKAESEVGINIVAELVQEWLPETLKRFNCSATDVYKAELTVEALNSIPPKYVYIKTEKDFANVDNLKDKYRGRVISTLVHLAINSKSGPKRKIIS